MSVSFVSVKPFHRLLQKAIQKPANGAIQPRLHAGGMAHTPHGDSVRFAGDVNIPKNNPITQALLALKEGDYHPFYGDRLRIYRLAGYFVLKNNDKRSYALNGQPLKPEQSIRLTPGKPLRIPDEPLMFIPDLPQDEHFNYGLQPASGKLLAQIQQFEAEFNIGPEPLEQGFRSFYNFYIAPHSSRFDEQGFILVHPEEVLLVNPEHDPDLANYLAKIKADFIRQGRRDRYTRTQNVEWIYNQVQSTLKNATLVPPSLKGVVPLGKIIKGGYGACRHKSVLFKVIADALGIPSSMVRGFHFNKEKNIYIGHQWNTIVLEDGIEYPIDTTLLSQFEHTDPITSEKYKEKYHPGRLPQSLHHLIVKEDNPSPESNRIAQSCLC